MKVYTRKGDDGSTALGDGSRTSKAAERVAAYGDVDELSAVLGVLATEPLEPAAAEPLAEVQSLLFDVGAFLADPGGSQALPEEVRDPAWLERWVDRMDAELPRLRNFVVPGGTRAAALAHLARTVCRRAERSVVSLSATDAAAAAVVPFLNRLSDSFFVLARWLNARAGAADVLWRAR